MQSLDGILLLNKPEGMTSHACVSKVRKLFGVKKAGHTGTLDPDVTGVLPICLGKATRLTEYLLDRAKEYRAELTLGIATDTEDASGEVERRQPVTRPPDKKRVAEVMRSFVGELKQVPPMYSSVKMNGKRLHELAREGKEIERPARTVHIYDLVIEEMDLDATYPRITFTVSCSKGTYIRTLCKDIGEKLGYPAHMSHLVRTRSGPFGLENCKTFHELEQNKEAGRLAECLLPMDKAVEHLQALSVDEPLALSIQHGRSIASDSLASFQHRELIRLYSNDGAFLALYRVEKEGEKPRAKAEKVFA